MKNNIIRLVVVGAFLPMLAFAQTTDVDTSSANSCAVISQNLRYLSRDTNGSSGVSILQDFLSSKGYLKSQPTGFFGVATRKAVIAFQNDNGLRATPPGFVGAGTRAKIQAIDCGKNTAVSSTPTLNTNIQAAATLNVNALTVQSHSKIILSGTFSNTSGLEVIVTSSALPLDGLITSNNSVLLVDERSDHGGNVQMNDKQGSWSVGIPAGLAGGKYNVGIYQDFYELPQTDYSKNTRHLLTSGVLSVIDKNVNISNLENDKISVTLAPGQTTIKTGLAHPMSITLRDFTFADSKGSGQYCPNVVFSNGVAPDYPVTICLDNQNYLPVMYQGFSILLTKSSSREATFTISPTNASPSATIDTSSLISSSANPTVSGSAFNLNGVVVEIRANGGVHSFGNDHITGSVPVLNNKWSATLTEISLSAGNYPIKIIRSSDRYLLSTGTLTVLSR